MQRGHGDRLASPARTFAPNLVGKCRPKAASPLVRRRSPAGLQCLQCRGACAGAQLFLPQGGLVCRQPQEGGGFGLVAVSP